MVHATTSVSDTAVRHTHVCAASSVDRVRCMLASRSSVGAETLGVVTRERVERCAPGEGAAERSTLSRFALLAFSRGDSLGRCSQREKEWNAS